MKLKELESGDRVYSYEDIYLVPNPSVVKSRDEVSAGVNWGKWDFDCPAVPSNMTSVIDEKIARYCAFNKIPYFYHRFGTTLSIFEFVKLANKENWPLISISVGVKEGDKSLLHRLDQEKLRVDMVLIDVAHGMMESVSDMLIYSRALGFYTGAGNIWGDRQSVEFLQDAGADFLKCGLSIGKVCTTYSTTGFGSPMFSAAIELGKWATVPVIIDGGVRNNGDIVKALRGFFEYSDRHALVMIGSLFAACIDAPGENIYNSSYWYGVENLHRYENMKAEFSDSISIAESGIKACKSMIENAIPEKKKYYGSASAKNKQQSGQPVKHIEGFEVELPCNGMTFAEKIQEIKESLQSAISYSGGHTLGSIRDSKWVTVK